ncbi:MAG: flagellar biosynthesis protein FliQ [Angelakisella sp.]|jgi:flagellar biosynthetic protein FliQ|nr:flagellar biosynthesis protein FliQ [Angelakisella sp.]MCI9528098.1 flagellar biosynthesis protein FliQ [Angelakisella sp.]
MTQGEVLGVFQEALLVALKLSAPLLVASIAIGLVVAIFQAATQIHEQTLTFVPKVLVIALMLIGLGSWMMTLMNDLVQNLFAMMTRL